MAKINIVKFKETFEEDRLDAEFFDVSCIALERKVTSKKWSYLKDLVIQNNRLKQPIYREKSEIIILNSQFIRDFIDIEEAKKGENIPVKKNSVMINATGLGTLGRVCINYLEENISVDNHVNIIYVNEDKINPFFLMTFLKSKFGQIQINRRFHGSSGQIEIYPSDFDKFKIPLISINRQQEIEKLCKEAFNKYEESKKLSKETEQLLLDELNLKNNHSKSQITFQVQLSKVLIANRLDANFFQPKYNEISNKIKNYFKGFITIRDLLTDLKKGKLLSYSSIKMKNSEPYILIDNLKNGTYTLFSEEKGVTCKETDVLIVADGESSGFVTTGLSGFVGSTLIKVSFDNSRINNFCLSELLKIHFKKMNELKTGSGVPHLDKNVLLNLEIPLLDKKVQNRIAENIRDSFRLRKEAKELLEEAKIKVEEFIEK